MRRLTALAGVATGLLAGLAMGMAAESAVAGEVNVYSYRQPFLVEPLFDEFTKETGHKVNVVFAQTGLIERARQEGRLSPMDVLLTVDVGRLTQAKEAGITAPVDDPVINAAIPAQYREPEGHWIGLTSRIRVIYAAKGRVKDAKALTYESLADPRFKGRICTRSGKHVYQIGLVASMIAHHGAEWTETWLQGVKANLAHKPSGNDRSQVKAIWQGECDLSLGNHYYYLKMMADPEQRPWAESVDVIFPNQADRGAHANISGMVLGAHAPDPEAAKALMRFLVSKTAQEIYADVNGEYPLRADAEWSPQLQALGHFKIDPLPLQDISDKRAEALLMTDRVRYDH
ncbi:MAG: extracellular solute-binding protein [Alphaproteobacteria bacterium]|nr:extracellular solute-binding protein [Alphaproteobacteria bacterium]MCB9930392.1 extracellular solute-binding protein [Alphaproteobacteria bacterium]